MTVRNEVSGPQAVVTNPQLPGNVEFHHRDYRGLRGPAVARRSQYPLIVMNESTSIKIITPGSVGWVTFRARCLHHVASARVVDPRTYVTSADRNLYRAEGV